MTPSAFQLIHKIHFHDAILSAIGFKDSRENEGSIYGTEEVCLPLWVQKRKRIAILFSLVAIGSFPQAAEMAGGGTTGETMDTLPSKKTVLLSED